MAELKQKQAGKATSDSASKLVIRTPETPHSVEEADEPEPLEDRL